ncbi:MAG: LysR family transcriptional regulator [Polyangiaceae bacterium]|nr:LysR family transcriptional regulator [Myxococcales bacterium]MCB9588364.1 LysR family transcriptional regulator [Polyangiaceae bacterium]
MQLRPAEAWQAMLNWDDLRFFLALHRNSNLARAASELKVNATTVGRRLSALEEQVGARLFDRTPDGYIPTSAGVELVQHAERMEAEAFGAERRLTGADTRLKGSVRVSVTEMLATRFIASHLRTFHTKHPGITLELSCTQRSVNLTRREADVALRLSRPKEDNVITKRIAQIDLSLYAAGVYSLDCGIPEDAEKSLKGHRVLMFADSRAFNVENQWLEERLDGATIAFRSDSVSSIYAAASCGLGIALLPRSVAERDSTLVRIRTETSPTPREVWQTIHADMRNNARVRAVTEFLAGVVAARVPNGTAS